MSPIFKGPIFVSHRTATKRQRSFTALPVARGVVNEQDFLEQRSGSPTRDEVDTIVVDECKEVSPEDIERVRVIMERYQPDFAFQHGFYSHALSEQDIDKPE